MLLLMKILVLLWLINFAPPLLAHLLGSRWDTPLDRERVLSDGKPLFGPHKTQRGVLAASAAGCLAGMLLGFPWWVGLSSGILSMAGDLLASFGKRRFGLPSGSIVIGWDQVLEGLLPFLVLKPSCGLAWWHVFFLVSVFTVSAYYGSKFFKGILLRKPFDRYSRPLNSRVRLREFRACQITSHPLHHFLNFEDALYYHFIMKGAFQLLGIYKKGMQNALKLDVQNVTFHFPDLPPSFEGYTILFLSDLHLDGLKGLTERVRSIVRLLPADLCIIGGDLRMETHGPFTEALAQLRRLIPEIQVADGIYGVLGNHDCLEIVDALEKIGVRFLINDAIDIHRNGERLWLVGVDDPHYYQCHDLELAFKDVPEEEFSLLAAHSNEIYKEAAEYGARLYLCGHTHAGQIQIPPFGPIFTHSKAPRRYCKGAWEYRGMRGYTSCGVGVSGVPVRFFSQGEVTFVTLRRGSPREETNCVEGPAATAG